ncbi:MAG: CubicO group peptidase (beta-lactamase class C family) [Saprospiraceae bacterium]|jgi:CubicO group peptidase (beta-lactamase class C family)
MRFSFLLLFALIFHSCEYKPAAEVSITSKDVPQVTVPIKTPVISEEDLIYIKNHFDRFIKKRHFNGSIVIAKNNEIIYDTTLGYANIRRRIPLKDTSAVQLASITKPITAAVILSLIQEGKLNLNDAVTAFLPRLPEEYNKITIKMMLSHQSGLTQYYYYCDHVLEDKECIVSNDSLIEIINCHNPGFAGKPGRKFNYCNTNFALLASVAERIEEKSFHQIVEERIIEPCGMKNSFLLDLSQDTLPQNLVYGNNEWNTLMEFDYLDGIVGDKGFFSTARDLLLFDKYFFNCLMLSDSMLQVVFEPQVKIKNNGNSYGLGWRLRFDENLGKIIYHPGWWRGNRHLYFKIPSKDYTVIMLSNSLKGSRYNLNDLLAVFNEVE